MARRGEAKRSETHQPLLAWIQMPTGPLTLVAPAFTQALMAKEPEEAKKQEKQDMAEKRADALRMGMNVTLQDWQHWRLRWARYKRNTKFTD